jgi:hypothetical protein
VGAVLRQAAMRRSLAVIRWPLKCYDQSGPDDFTADMDCLIYVERNTPGALGVIGRGVNDKLSNPDRYRTRNDSDEARMKSLISGETLTCHLNGRTSYDRSIGSCTLSDGREIGTVMIQEGQCGRFF